MGWTSYHRSKGQPTDRHLARYLFGDRAEFVAYGMADGVFYGAVREFKDPDTVWCLIVLTKWAPRAFYNFFRKELSEGGCGEGYYDAPARVLDALTPTDDPDVNAWRQACRDRLVRVAEVKARVAALRPGSVIRFQHELSFGSHGRASRFEMVAAGRARPVWRALCDDGATFQCRLRARWAEQYTWQAEPTTVTVTVT